MQIENDKFYVLNVDGNKEIYETETEAIGQLKANLKGTELGEDKVSIIEVDVSGDDWKIQQVSWSQIAIQLLRGEGNG